MVPGINVHSIHGGFGFSLPKTTGHCEPLRGLSQTGCVLRRSWENSMSHCVLRVFFHVRAVSDWKCCWTKSRPPGVTKGWFLFFSPQVSGCSGHPYPPNRHRFVTAGIDLQTCCPWALKVPRCPAVDQAASRRCAPTTW